MIKKQRTKLQKVLMVLADIKDDDLKPMAAPAVQEPVITNLTAFHVEMPNMQMCETLKTVVGRYALVMADPNDMAGTTFGAILPLSGEKTLYDQESFAEWLVSEAHRVASQSY